MPVASPQDSRPHSADAAASAAILVLGMHRSGTSCLAGSLEQRGLHLGEVYQWRPYNAKGNRENQRVMDLNDAVLAHSGGRWDDPPATLAWTDAHARVRDALIAGLRGESRGHWGFKDPRTLLTLAFWRQGLDALHADGVRMVGTFRHPLAVARSLNARDPAMSLEQGMALWQAYNERLLQCHAHAPFPVLSFDADEAGYRNAVDMVARGCGLGPAPADEIFERGLRTQAGEDAVELPPAVQAVYRQLQAVAGA